MRKLKFYENIFIKIRLYLGLHITNDWTNSDSMALKGKNKNNPINWNL